MTAEGPLAGVPVMVLAAGLGTRLRPLTEELPKPAVPVGHRALVAWTLDFVARQGGRRVVVNAHHLPAAIERAVAAAGAEHGLEARVLREVELLGTGGGIRNAEAALFEDGAQLAVVLNSDILFEPDLAEAIATHRRLGAIATMVVREDPNAERYGAIDVDAEGRVRRLLGLPESAAAPLRTTMFTGVHVLSRAAFSDLPTQGCIVRHGYRRWIDGGAVVAGHVERARWQDLGTLRAYLDANLELAAAGPGGNLIHPNAHVAAGAALEQCVMGEGARVGPGVALRRTVVWPNATATADASEAIVTPTKTVQV